MEYKASLDTLSKVITFGVFILFIFIGQKSVKTMMLAEGDLTTILVHSGILLLFISIVLGPWLFAPKSYTVTSSELIINRSVGKVEIKFSDIDEVRILSDAEMSGLLRTFGNGGLFGYYGKFYNSKMGHMTLYATQRKNRILIQTSQGKKIIITPDDIGIIEKLK
jgi:hypothetical protein